MADNSLIKNGFTVSPKTGTGNATLTITGSERTGRVDADAVTFTATLDKFPSVSKSFKVIQKGKPEFITITTKTYSANAAGQNVTIQGKSNSANLSIVPGANTISGLSYKLAVAGVTDESWNGSSDTTVDGDPGASAEYDFTLTVTVPENKSVSALVAKFAVKNANADVTSGEITINQAAGVKTYAIPVITKFNYPAENIPAKGDEVYPEIAWTQNWGWNGSTDEGVLEYGFDNIPEDYDIKFTGAGEYGKVFAESKSYYVSGVTKVASVTAQVTSNGKTSAIHPAVDVYQEANEVSYGDVTFTAKTPSASDIPASGGTVGENQITWSGEGSEIVRQRMTFTSGAVVEISDIGVTATVFSKIALTYSDEVTAASKGTTVSARTEAGVITITATGAGGKTATKTLTIYQAANTATYAVPTFVAGTGTTIDTDNAVTIDWSADVHGIQIFEVDGGGVFKLMKQTATYTSGESESITADAAALQAGGAFSGTVEALNEVDGFRLSGSVIQTKQVAVTQNTTVVARNGFKVKVSVTMNSKSTTSTITFNQAAAAAYLTVSPTTIDFAADGSTSTLTIESNDAWTIS